MLTALLAPFFASPFDAILDDPKLSGALVAAIVSDLDGNVIYERNSAQRVVPASNQKLLSNAFALFALGPSFRPQTRIWKMGDRTVVDSPGDPLLSYGVLVQARNRLRLNPMLPVYVREGYAPGIPATWEWDDLPNKYAAPITAFTVDRGSFEVWSVLGRPALRPEGYGVKIERLPGLGAPQIFYDLPNRRVRVIGKLPPEGEVRLDTLAIAKPDEAAAKILGSRMVATQEVPSREPDLIILGSATADMLRACLPVSDNNIAEHLLLLGSGALGPVSEDPYRDARIRLTDFLTKVAGLRKEDLHVVDGSGMSRHNLLTVRGLATLLAYESRQPSAGVWRAALAKPGSGTLAGRLQGLTFEGKTGTLDMVVALSGYVRATDGRDRIVSIVLNHFNGVSADARQIADAFARQVSSL